MSVTRAIGVAILITLLGSIMLAGVPLGRINRGLIACAVVHDLL